MISLDEREITFVVQGPFKKQTDHAGVSTATCLLSIRRWFPEARLIYSASDADAVPRESRDLVDELCQPEDPGPVICGYVNNRPVLENVNRQIAGTCAGLRRVRTSYAVKMRSDFAFTSSKLLASYRKAADKISKRFLQPVAIIDIFTRYSYRDDPFRTDLTSFHLSDFFFLGLTKDLLAYWEGPYLESDVRQFSSRHVGPGGYPTIEQRLAHRFYSRFGLCAPLPERVTTSQELMLTYLDAVSQDFIILSAAQLGMRIPERFRTAWYNSSLNLSDRNLQAVRTKLARSSNIGLGLAGALRGAVMFLERLRSSQSSS